jgi:hypothetical protein
VVGDSTGAALTGFAGGVPEPGATEDGTVDHGEPELSETLFGLEGFEVVGRLCLRLDFFPA